MIGSASRHRSCFSPQRGSSFRETHPFAQEGEIVEGPGQRDTRYVPLPADVESLLIETHGSVNVPSGTLLYSELMQ
jgi:hypothetical protein